MEPAGERRMHAIEGMRCLLISLRRIAGAHVLGGGIAYRLSLLQPFHPPCLYCTAAEAAAERREIHSHPIPGNGGIR